jgi:glycine/D-amino acid oxidase-like deaminating enzyme
LDRVQTKSAFCNVAIVGGGPAGLTMAALLQEAGVHDVVVFEADSRPGGKCWTIEHEGVLHELGTCYTTIDHHIVNRWMRELGIRQVRLGKQMFEGVPFPSYVAGGNRIAMVAEISRYIGVWFRHHRAFKAGNYSDAQLAEWAMPMRDWLRAKKLPYMERFMERAITTMGYGLIDDITAFQALEWCTPMLFVTGILNELRMPVTGWQDFWDRLSERLDVRLGERVTHIERGQGARRLTTERGEYGFRTLIVATPMDCFAETTELTDVERRITDGIHWGTYVITVADVEDWFMKYHTDGFHDATVAGSYGKLLGARRAPDGVRKARAQAGRDSYLLAQQYFDEAPAGLEAMLEDGVRTRGGKLGPIIAQRAWRYFPSYRAEAVRAGLMQWMEEVQGVDDVWFTGSSFSHEAVSTISNFNARLLRRMMPTLRTEAAAVPDRPGARHPTMSAEHA